ncbi:MAG TPA: hypothetical protein VN748_12695 [Pseudonocardiaceae bacterium]|jgi:hypothetical protein|nr:hypothetical protein [Pseudonocardiaceae bacterium]
MSQEHENAKSTDSLTSEGQDALSALRGIWQAQGQTSADLDEACGNNNICKSMESVGFQGLAEDVGMPATSQSVGSNLRTAWKRKLEREGKVSQGTSVRDLIFGSSDQEDQQ